MAAPSTKDLLGSYFGTLRSILAEMGPRGTAQSPTISSGRRSTTRSWIGPYAPGSSVMIRRRRPSPTAGSSALTRAAGVSPDLVEDLLRRIADAAEARAGELLERAKSEDLDGFRWWRPRAVAEHLKRYGLRTKKTAGQKRYVDAIRNNIITFGIGPAGTGKSWLAVAMAVGAELGFDEVLAERLPEQKSAVVEAEREAGRAGLSSRCGCARGAGRGARAGS